MNNSPYKLGIGYYEFRIQQKELLWAKTAQIQAFLFVVKRQLISIVFEIFNFG